MFETARFDSPRALLAGGIAVGSAVGLCACATAHTSAGGHRTLDRAQTLTTISSSARASAAALTLERDPTDRDDDRPAGVDPDSDKELKFGAPASATETRAIAALLHRYYAIAARGDGARACALQFSLFVESLAEQERQRGRRGSERKICASVASGAFRKDHQEAVAGATALQLVQVRVSERRGMALAHFGPLRERLVSLYMEGGQWKMNCVLDAGSP